MPLRSDLFQELEFHLQILSKVGITHQGNIQQFLESCWRLRELCLEMNLSFKSLLGRSYEELHLPRTREDIRRTVLMYYEYPDIETGKPALIAGSSYLSDVSPKDKKWDEKKANAIIISDQYDRIGNQKYSERVSKCAESLLFALREVDPHKRALKLLEAQFCRVRFCPICAWRRTKMWISRFIKTVPSILNDHPNHHFLLLTLTVRSCSIDELRDTYNRMSHAFNLLVKRKIFPAIGYARAFEITRGKDGSCHPHFHVILMVKPSYFKGSSYLSHDKWMYLWKDCLKLNYDPSVNIKKTKGIEDKKYGGLLEVLKYSVKEADLIIDGEWLQGITEQLHKTRAIVVGGVFRKYLSENEPEDLINADLEEIETKETDPKFKFSWRKQVKRYQSD